MLPHSARAIDKLRSPTTSRKMNPMNECTRHEEPQGSGADIVEGNVVTVFTCLITATSHHCIYAHYGLHGFAMAGRHHSYLIHVCLGGNQTQTLGCSSIPITACGRVLGTFDSFIMRILRGVPEKPRAIRYRESLLQYMSCRTNNYLGSGRVTRFRPKEEGAGVPQKRLHKETVGCMRAILWV